MSEIQTLSDYQNIKCFDQAEANQKRIEIRRNAFQGMFKNPDDTHNLIHEKNTTPKKGDYFLSYRGDIHAITEVGETRNHKGFFEREEDRKKITPVKGILVLIEYQ
ncbi:TPA: hypothetical protein JRX92_003511 [Elizabethkingia anophelis]|nr:hypothetical protein [Elizabethkingia anophelis]